MKKNLTEQLFAVCIIIISIMIVSLGIVLPNMLLPIYEKNVYNYLRQPLSFVQNEEDILSKDINTEVAYIYISSNNAISISDNLDDIIDINNIDKLLSKLDLSIENGKFIHKRNTYYYVTSIKNNIVRVAITNGTYITKMKRSILVIIVEVVGISFILVSFFVFAWSNNLVNRIKKIKDKVDNINNEEYSHDADTRYSDELYTLDRAVQDMHLYLTKQEEYKNQMYQNISHDFKTPITVIKSYIEAAEDGIQTESEALLIVKEQVNKLETKVHSLLYLNKLNYLKEEINNLNEKYDVSIIINNSIEKFKISRPDINFVLETDKKSKIFRGSADMWEAIIDNILNNFIRYAKKTIKITIKNNKIILYNDGETIDDNVLNNIFTPYEKGVKGVFGLGLSIVKKTLHLLNYDISIENVKNGVKFTIYE